ncbi:hypothetical protein SOCE26_105080 [Sorangium cellulosum]|uniref:Uncharacterized protein n=1 Tax=Sorangium cellulosum TaxID=56 RepID=A0A2L0FBQ7_SORCE|nr:DUF1552 domain-containing protein [Sorangium cellulosum]AUX48963.1 hypothetical protein SOCE26_105080 [Sorangium cellulosum]
MRSHSRRNFIKGVGASLGASLLFSSFYDSVADAAPGRKAKRILVFFTMGTAPEIWKPTSVSGESPTYADGHCMKPLDEVKQHLVILDGLPSGSPANNHGSADGITGMGYFSPGAYGLISVDQFIVKKLEAAGQTSPVPFLLFGANVAASGKTGFYNGTNLAPTASPLSAFREAFSGVVPTTTPTPGGNPNAALEDMLRRRKSILDNLKSELATMKRDLGREQYYKLDLHLESIRLLERELEGSMQPGGGVPTGGACAPVEPAMDRSNHVTGNSLHLDTIVAAFACNRTRVASVQWGTDQEMRVDMPEIGVPDEEHNGLIHGNDPGHARLIKLERWLAEQFVGVIKKLKATPEPDGTGTLFDNTLVAWCRDMGDAPNHNQNEMKFVLASGDGGYLKTAPGGRFITSKERHERVLLSMIDAMGITDFSGFGDPALGSKSPLPGIAAT